MKLDHTFVNTREYQRSGLFYLKNGFYTDAPEETPDWEDFWAEEEKRCLHGYSVGGVPITGYHYYYLNYVLIPQVFENVDATGEKGKAADWDESLPAFWDGDFNYFWAVEIARYGIHNPELRAFLENALGITILDWDGGRHMVVLKARGKGYSWKSASMFARNYYHIRYSKNYALGGNSEALGEGDGLLDKTWSILSFNDKNCAWGSPRVIDKYYHKQSGVKDLDTGGYDGKLGQIIGIIINDPRKARGKRGELIKYEESGSIPNLIKAWETNRPSVEQGSKTVGLLEAFGTGGDKDSHFEGLVELFYKPEAYNVLPFANEWDDNDGKCGLFIPDYVNLEGFMDKDGNSDVQGAIDFEIKEREAKQNTNNSDTLAQRVAEHPFTPQDAILKYDINLLPTQELKEQLAFVEAEKLFNKGVNGHLVQTNKGVKFEIDTYLTQVKWNHRKEDDLTGCITIYEDPYKDDEGKVPDNLYMICHDPYDKDNSTADRPSLGAAYVIKLSNDLMSGDKIVANYVGRPARTEIYNDNLFKLAQYYNTKGKLAFENDRGKVTEYASAHKMMNYLMPEMDIIDKTGGGKLGRKYGYTMSGSERRGQSELNLADWLRSPRGVTKEGVQLWNLHYIYDIPTLQALINYNPDKNNDRVDALMGGISIKESLFNVKVQKIKEEKKRKFWNEPLFSQK